MGTDPRKRQKKLERRAAKRKEKKHSIVREHNVGLADRMAAAAKYPILHCSIGLALEDQGMGWVLLARELPGGQVAVASFLVDRYCLGVKDTFGEVLPRSEFEVKYVRKTRTSLPSRIAPPAEARKLLEEVAAYARSLGLQAHADYAKLMLLFGDTDPATSDAKFEFGKDGKPLFISGPHDGPARCREVLAILTNSCGPDGFHYMLPMSDADAIPGLSEGLESGKIRLIGPDEESAEAEDSDEEE